MVETNTIFPETYRKINQLITQAFNSSTLRRGLNTETQRARLQSLERKINSLLGSKKVFNNITKSQFYELQNMATERIQSYKNKLIEKDKSKVSKKFKEQVKQEKVKVEEKPKPKLPLQQKYTMLNPNLSDTSTRNLTVLFQNAAKMSGASGIDVVKGSASTAVDIPRRPDKINFNLKGFALIQDIAQNSAQHGYLDSDIDEGVKQKKITKSEAKNIKSFFNNPIIKPRISQVLGGDIDKAKQFYSPQFQKAFNTFLQTQYNEIFTKMPKDITPKESASKSKTSFTDKFTKKLKTGASMSVVPGGTGGGKTPMQEALGMYDPFNKPGPYMNKGGKVKPKPYAVGGKVYSNSVRKPNYK